MEIILISLIVILFLLYIIFAFWFSSIVLSPPPEDAKYHSSIDLEVNWEVNQPPILWRNPLLSLLVANNLIFYWIASILVLILIYIRNHSFILVILSGVSLLFLSFISLRIVRSIVIYKCKRHW